MKRQIIVISGGLTFSFNYIKEFTEADIKIISKKLEEELEKVEIDGYIEQFEYSDFLKNYPLDEITLEQYQEIIDNKQEMKIRARRQYWRGNLYKHKNKRQTNRKTYNHGKHSKK